MPKVHVLKAPRCHVCNNFWLFFLGFFWPKNVASRDGCFLLISRPRKTERPRHSTRSVARHCVRMSGAICVLTLERPTIAFAFLLLLLLQILEMAPFKTQSDGALTTSLQFTVGLSIAPSRFTIFFFSLSLSLSLSPCVLVWTLRSISTRRGSLRENLLLRRLNVFK